MEVTLDEQEIMEAIEAYMALKGFKADREFLFRRSKGELSVTINVKRANFSLEAISKYVNED